MGSILDSNRLKDIRVTGKGLSANLVESCISASFGTSISQVTEASLTFLDSPDLDIFRSGVLASGASVAYGGWSMTSRVVSLGSGTAGPELSVRAPSMYVERLRAQTGAKSWGNQDVSAWVRSVAVSAGLATTVVQPGLGRRTIVRTKSDGDQKESTWDVITGLAQATGCWVFEYGRRLVFARPSWLIKHDWGGRFWPFYWNDWLDYSEGLQGMPAYTRDPGQNPAESLTLRLLSADADQARPGDRVFLGGKNVGPMGGTWIVTGVSYAFTIAGVTTLTCQRAIDPVIPPANTGSGTAGVQNKATAVSKATKNVSGVDAWMARTNGAAVDVDGAYGAQCVDLVALYNTQFVGGVNLFGNGNQWYGNPGVTGSYVRVGAGSPAQKGDIACWGSFYGGGYGHVAIVVADQGASIRVLTQNPGPAHYDTLSKQGLQGYLRPRKFA